MADGPIFVRVVKGEESLGMSFFFSAAIIAAYFGYMWYVPQLSNFWIPYIQGGYLFVLTYAAVSMHNACMASSTWPRLITRTYVVLLVALSTWFAWSFYGLAGFLYPLIIWACVFIFQER